MDHDYMVGWMGQYFNQDKTYRKLEDKYNTLKENYNILLDEYIKLNSELKYYKDKYGEKKE